MSDDPQRDEEHTEQHGEGDNIDTQVNEAPDVNVTVEKPAEDAERAVDGMDKK